MTDLSASREAVAFSFTAAHSAGAGAFALVREQHTLVGGGATAAA